MPNSTSNVPTTAGSVNFDEAAAAVRRMRNEAIDDAALRVLTAVSGSEITVVQALPGVLPPDRLLIIFVAPEVMARLTTLTKGA